MATFYADASGAILRLAVTDQDLSEGAPTGTVAQLEFDPATNPAIIPAFSANYLGTQLLGGTLSQNEQAVTINAAGQDYQTSQYLQQAISVFKGTETLPSNAVIQNAFQAVQSGTATLLQTQIVLAVTARALGLMAQKLVAAGILG